MNKNKKITLKIEYLYLLILLLYPVRKAFIGIDMMDAGYSLGNYRFFDSLDNTWKLATYLANVTGVIFSKLPYGNFWVGMNVYTSLLIGLTATVTYVFLTRRYSEYKHVIFVAELVVISLCWSPSVILYQNLGYQLMTYASLFLYKAITENKNKLYVIAGIILGGCVFVRMPNITYMALAVPVWYGAYQRKKNAVINTLYCVAGYLMGFVIPLTVICVKYGLGSYIGMINGLFGMTDKATDYKPTSMLTASWIDCFKYGAWLWLFAAYIIAGIILFKIMSGKFEVAKKIIYILGLAVLLRFCYGRGMFGIDYTEYFCMYKWMTVFVLLVVVLCVYQLISKHATEDVKLWAVFMITIIFVTPLGSNNGIYPTINNLFIIGPVSVIMILKIINEKSLNCFSVKSVVYCILLCITIQGILFGIFFNFHDNKIEGQERVKADIEGSVSTKGLYSTVDKINELNELGAYLNQNNLLDKEVILYGNLPAISYIFDMRPAIFTTWADLDSNPVERLKKSLEEVDFDQTVVIISNSQKYYTEYENTKLELIKDYILSENLECGFNNNEYSVYYR